MFKEDFIHFLNSINGFKTVFHVVFFSWGISSKARTLDRPPEQHSRLLRKHRPILSGWKRISLSSGNGWTEPPRPHRSTGTCDFPAPSYQNCTRSSCSPTCTRLTPRTLLSPEVWKSLWTVRRVLETSLYTVTRSP